MTGLDKTHDPAAKSWIETANDPACHFPLQNLPYGVFSTNGDRRIGVAIGDRIVDLTCLESAGLLTPAPGRTVFCSPTLNAFMALGPAAWKATRAALFDLLRDDNPRLSDDAALRDQAMVAIADAQLHLPIFVRSYTDFYASAEHATNVGTMFRGAENAFPPNWLHIPIGYNGRASSVIVSGTPVHRPWGQLKAAEDDAPRFAPSERLDIELELGAIVGTPNDLGRPVTVAEAYDMIFGYVLLNDWSARDIQSWEYQPLGPFLAKATATTISPWIVTRDALLPYRTPTPQRRAPLLPYLRESTPDNFDIELDISLTPAGGRPDIISRTNAKGLYYSCAQQLAHHTSSGCAMCTGDLLGSGTISSPEKTGYGSLLELSWDGKNPIALSNGTSRSFLLDGDTVTFRGHCDGAGHRIGFGECSGTVLPAIDYPGLAP